MSIENTTKNPHKEWLLGGDPESIERQEMQGQEQLATSSQLPTDGLTPEAAARCNIQIVSASKDDPLFTDVTLPKGWQIKPTGHSMWSDLLDETGTKRAGIFYKAAFYDRKAFIRFD